jgi:hypothetical protein
VGLDIKKDLSKLTSIVFNGYAASTDFINKNYDAVLRIASVNYRIAGYIASNPKDAAEIQGPFLNRYGGSQLDTQDVVLLYTKVDPFFGYEKQREWYTDESSPYFWRYTVQAFIDADEKSGAIAAGKWTPETIELTHQIWTDLEKHRVSAKKLIDANEASAIKAGSAAKAFMDAAKHNYEIFNYLDADTFAAEAARLLSK